MPRLTCYEGISITFKYSLKTVLRMTRGIWTEVTSKSQCFQKSNCGVLSDGNCCIPHIGHAKWYTRRIPVSIYIREASIKLGRVRSALTFLSRTAQKKRKWSNFSLFNLNLSDQEQVVVTKIVNVPHLSLLNERETKATKCEVERFSGLVSSQKWNGWSDWPYFQYIKLAKELGCWTVKH